VKLVNLWLQQLFRKTQKGREPLDPRPQMFD
jgi:hypothetical protein